MSVIVGMAMGVNETYYGFRLLCLCNMVWLLVKVSVTTGESGS